MQTLVLNCSKFLRYRYIRRVNCVLNAEESEKGCKTKRKLIECNILCCCISSCENESGFMRMYVLGVNDIGVC